MKLKKILFISLIFIFPFNFVLNFESDLQNPSYNDRKNPQTLLPLCITLKLLEV